MSSSAPAGRVLVIDDEDSNVALLEDLLASEGYDEVDSTTDPVEGLRLFAERPPDIVLLDLHMPGLDGFELMARLRAQVPGDRFLPVLVLTADVQPETRQRALAGGASDFVTKPIDTTEVLLRIGNLLRTRRLHAEQAQARADAERDAARAGLLAEASRVMAGSFDISTTLAQLAALSVPTVADACVIGLETPDGGFRRVGAAHVDPALEAYLRALALPGAEHVRPSPPEARVLEGSGPYLVADVTDAMLDASVPEPSGRALLHRLAPRSIVAVPLETAAGVAGSLLFLSTTPGRRFEERDLVLATELGRRAGLAVENARLYQTAVRATDARDEMLAVVAHDLRNPLNAVVMTGEMLHDAAVEEGRAAEAAQLELLVRAAGAMNDLIEDLLELQRLEGGRLAVRPAPVQPEAVVVEALEILRPLATRAGLSLDQRVAWAGDVPMDRGRIVQVLSNLVGNAIKFTPAGGRIEVRAERDGSRLVVGVRDTGPGIPPDQLARVFGTFWQADAADGRGIGLGLTIAKGIVEAHGGSIWVESAPGEGSDFCFALPLEPGSDGADPGVGDYGSLAGPVAASSSSMAASSSGPVNGLEISRVAGAERPRRTISSSV